MSATNFKVHKATQKTSVNFQCYSSDDCKLANTKQRIFKTTEPCV